MFVFNVRFPYRGEEGKHEWSVTSPVYPLIWKTFSGSPARSAGRPAWPGSEHKSHPQVVCIDFLLFSAVPLPQPVLVVIGMQPSCRACLCVRGRFYRALHWCKPLHQQWTRLTGWKHVWEVMASAVQRVRYFPVFEVGSIRPCISAKTLHQ